MKYFFSLSFVALLFSSFLLNDTAEKITSVEGAEAVTTMVKICDFHSFTGGAGAICADGTLFMDIDENCTAGVTATVRAVNLAANPVLGQMYSLTTGASDIYYEYTIPSQGITQTLAPISQLEFKGAYDPTTGLPFFEYEVKVYFDVDAECMTAANPLIPMIVRLLDDKGALYDIDSHAAPGQMFYCGTFYETCASGGCSTNSACGGGAPPEYNIAACGPCNGCASKRSETLEGGDLEAIASTVFNDFTVQPNPFDGYLNLEYTLPETAKVNVELLDAKGSVVYQQLDMQSAGEQIERIPTNDLTKGIYFCRVTVGAEVITKKVVKLK